MLNTRAYAAKTATSALAPFEIHRRDVGAHDILIQIQFCGVCHSDIHQVRDEWGGSIYPIVPGHEIVGTVSAVGAEVKKFKVGDRAGVGCFVDSCRDCPSCKSGLEQYCEVKLVSTYNGTDKQGQPTYGGYSSQVVVDEAYGVKVPANISLEAAAPLLCAGITTYSPLRHWQVKKGQRVGIVGLGGLGHMGVKLAAAMGAEVTVLSSSNKKAGDAKRLGAHHYVATNEAAALPGLGRHFDLILDTVSAPHDLNAYLSSLKTDGTMVLLGVPEKPTMLGAFPLVGRRRTLAGSMIGGIAETQEMLDFCSERNLAAEVEVIAMSEVNGAYERMLKGDVRYRFVIDLKTL